MATNLTLQSGDKMPSVGIGLWKIPKDQAADATYEAIKAGYRCIDEACDYGNEVECGQGIKKAIDEGLVSRKDLFVTSKLWNTYHHKEHVKMACQRTLQDLGLEYLDLYLIHFPICLKFVPFETRYPPEWKGPDEAGLTEDPVPISETWKAMEELVKEGLVRNIGVCNMGAVTIRDILSYAEVKPAVLQVELHPYNTQEKLLRFCADKGIKVTAFSCLGSASYVELNMATANDSVMTTSVVTDIAKATGKTPGQVVLRWGVQRGTAIIPKTTKAERLKENIDLFSFELTEEQMSAISALNTNRRFNDPGVFCEGMGTFFPIYE